MQPHQHPVVILGTGMGALGAAHRLAEAGVAAVLYDGNDYFGGHTASFSHPGGWVFDDGPHVSFTKDARIRSLLEANVEGGLRDVRARLDNYWHGRYLEHPVQLHLLGLPADLITRIVVDFVAALDEPEQAIGDYETWLRTSYGDAFAETFPMVYAEKYHTTAAANLTTDWLGPRMYRPSLAEMVRGALENASSDAHYVTSFRYPERGGFGAFIAPFQRRFEVRLASRVTAVLPGERRVEFANGAAIEYDQLISTIPLPALVPMVAGAPAAVVEAARQLTYSKAVLVNLGIAREGISDAHVRYIYDPDLIFVRLSYPHLLSPHCAPAGHSSVQAEVYFSDRYRPLTDRPEGLIEPVIADLRRSGLLREDDEISFREARLMPFANVIYDHARASALNVVTAFLAESSIHTAGRYGRWDHAWTDEAFISGEQAAEAAMADLGRHG